MKLWFNHEDKKFVFGYDYFGNKSIKEEICYDSFDVIPMSDACTIFLYAVKRDDKIGLFSVYETGFGGYGSSLSSCPPNGFIYDEIWAFSPFDSELIAYIVYRINNNWGVFRILMKEEAVNEHLCPCIYPDKESAQKAAGLGKENFYNPFNRLTNDTMYEDITALGEDYIESSRADAKKRVCPAAIQKLEMNEVFVFGSNLAGKHGGGAAKTALDKFGAIWGHGVGLQGQSYAIPTMHGGTAKIKPYVDDFIIFAQNHPELTFFVTPIGCGIAGFDPKEMAPLFEKATELENVYLPQSFLDVLLS